MERYCALVELGKVVNIVVVDSNDTDTIETLGGSLLSEGSQVSIGWNYDGVDFTPPPPTPPTVEELAIIEALAAAKADVAIQYLVTHTPAECYAYVQANVTNLATAVNFIGKIAMVLSIIAKNRMG